MSAAKAFNIPKKLVDEAFKAVKANAGGGGVDEQSIADFEANLKNNLWAFSGAVMQMMDWYTARPSNRPRPFWLR